MFFFECISCFFNCRQKSLRLHNFAPKKLNKNRLEKPHFSKVMLFVVISSMSWKYPHIAYMSFGLGELQGCLFDPTVCVWGGGGSFEVILISVKKQNCPNRANTFFFTKKFFKNVKCYGKKFFDTQTNCFFRTLFWKKKFKKHFEKIFALNFFPLNCSFSKTNSFIFFRWNKAYFKSSSRTSPPWWSRINFWNNAIIYSFFFVWAYFWIPKF